MTPSERKALLFLAAVGMLGVGVRAVGAPGDAPRVAETAADRVALDAQLAAVDRAMTQADADRPARRRARDASRDDAGGATARARREIGADVRGVTRRPRARRDAAGGRSSDAVDPVDAPLVDVDVADVTALEGLPGIGPALARRIVDDRARLGTYGSLAALERVRGVGPRLRARVAPFVTFSTSPRPPSAGDGRRVAP